MNDTALAWKPICKTEMCKTPVFTVNEIKSISPQNVEKIFVSLSAPEWVIVIPIITDANGKQHFLMVKQWRHGSAHISIEFPGGVVDPDKNDGQGVVNVNFLQREWSPDFVMQVLRSKLISNQYEFDTWIAQQNNAAYTFVYLQGKFTANRGICLPNIGTQDIIGIGDVIITIEMRGSETFSFFGEIPVDVGIMGIEKLNKGKSISNIHLAAASRRKAGDMVSICGQPR